ncbi:hypothetical protein [Methylobacterium nigriterrae]|uniref:hypothetical protein n=1 Tax=Methylobacterium nigriterrae TaxID=3127512 RepID=UPI0030136FD3
MRHNDDNSHAYTASGQHPDYEDGTETPNPRKWSIKPEQAVEYLSKRFGINLTTGILAAFARAGGGPPYIIRKGKPYYSRSFLRSWARLTITFPDGEEYL